MKNLPNFKDSMKYNSSCDYNISEDWALYEKNYEFYRSREPQENKIPKIVHQIWVGGPVKESEKKYIENVRQNLSDDWEYKFWTDDNIHDLKYLDKELYQKAGNTRHGVGKQADIVRYAILYEYGGIYLDTDFILCKDFNNILDLDFFAGLTYDETPGMFNGLIGCIKESPVIKDFLSLDREIDDNEIMDITGPWFTTRKVLKHIKENENVVIFPNSFFYPFPNFPRDRVEGEDWRNYIKEETIGMHFWSSIWNH